MTNPTGFMRGVSKQDTPLATPEGRAIKSAGADNPQVKPMAHSTASGIDKAASATVQVGVPAGTVRKVEQPKAPARPIMRALD